MSSLEHSEIDSKAGSPAQWTQDAAHQAWSGDQNRNTGKSLLQEPQSLDFTPVANGEHGSVEPHGYDTPEPPPEKPPTEPPPEKPPEKPPTEPHCTVDCGPPPPPPPPPEKPEEPSRNVNTANADANANAAGGKVNMVTRQGAATMPVLTSTSECAEARAFGINLFVIGVGAGEQWLNQTCEQIKTVKAVCGIANENTSLAIEALKIAGSVNENRFEQRLATRISHDKAWDGRRVNGNCAVEKTKLENMLAEQREKTEED